jgi:hypothetical protein
MTRVAPQTLASLVREIDPSRRGTGPDQSPGIVTEAEKPAARAVLDARVAQLEGMPRAAGMQGHLEQLRALRRRLDEPGELDARSPGYGRAQSDGVAVAAVDTNADFRLSPEELEAGIAAAGRRAVELDARQRQAPAGPRATTLSSELNAALADGLRLRQHLVLARLEAVLLPRASYVDVRSVEGLLSLRDTLDAEIGRWSSTADPAVRQLLAKDPAAVGHRQRDLAAARSAVSMTLGGPHAQAQALYDATWGRPGSDETAAQAALAHMFIHGTKAEANLELTRLMRVHGVTVPEGNGYAAIRHTIESELSFVDREVAERMFSTGKDDLSTHKAKYVVNALVKPFDAAFDWSVDNPGAAAAAGGGAAIALATLPLSLLVTVGLGVGVFEMSSGLAHYSQAKTRAQEIEGIDLIGSGVSTAATAMLPAFRAARGGGVRTGRTSSAPAVPDGVDPRNFLHRTYQRTMGYLGRQADLMSSRVVDEPRVVYRVAYYAPTGDTYAWSSLDAQHAALDARLAHLRRHAHRRGGSHPAPSVT